MQAETKHRRIIKSNKRDISKGVYLGAMLPSNLKPFIKKAKRDAPKGDRYYTENSKGNPATVTPKTGWLLFSTGALISAWGVIPLRNYQVNPFEITVNLTDLVGSYVYPGILDLIPDERIDFFKDENDLVIRQGSTVFRMKGL